MKKNALTAVVLGSIAVLGLAACSPASESDASPSASASTDAVAVDPAADAAALETIEWTDEDGVPTLAFDTPLTVTDIATRHIADGDGEVIEEGQNVTLDYVVYSGTDASQIYSTFEAGTPEVVTMADGQVVEDLYDALIGQQVGADLLYVYPDTSSEDGAAVVMAVTASSAVTPLERAEGTAVKPAKNLPTVTLDDDGKPSIDFSDAGKKPEELVVQPLIEGDGQEIAEGDQITVHYTGWIWNGDQFDSSWDRGAATSFTLASGSLIDGWVKGLAGQKVGSQVLLVIPPDLAYGDQESDTIPADSTLVFVVDILAAS
ncbi:FKBP-type peptidyl-prolyl cis-trans isomerase [Demequina maris]|uniref:FKBP-type peptidyl-prolyl cis-trans isomerase n=1 Tax=Demequina maris TaxID=1638982 RepID=UPI000784182A|nr:FKBP-type peptidyl-prolyl cis-trans isomerase [Demequina maris]